MVALTHEKPEGKPWRVREAAKFIGISGSQLFKLIGDGKIPALRFGKRVLLADHVVKRLITEGI